MGKPLIILLQLTSCIHRKELGMELAVCKGEPTSWDKKEVFRDQNFLDRIKSFVMFIGYARSGHSIVAALLDAHSHIAIAHELNIVKIWDTSYRNNSSKTRIDLFGEIIDNTIDTISDEKGFSKSEPYKEVLHAVRTGPLSRKV